MATVSLFVTIDNTDIDSIYLEIENTSSLRDLWWSIYEVVYDHIIHKDDFKIFYSGKELTDWDDTIADLGICPESTIRVIDKEEEVISVVEISGYREYYFRASDDWDDPDVTEYYSYHCTPEVYGIHHKFIEKKLARFAKYNISRINLTRSELMFNEVDHIKMIDNPDEFIDYWNNSKPYCSD